MSKRAVSAAAKAVFVIAEAGVNHNGSLDFALQLVDVAAEAGADAVKFQTFRAKDLVSAGAPQARYARRAVGAAQSQIEMIRALELGWSAHRVLAQRCRQRGIEFLSTPFGADLVDKLIAETGMRRVKLPSGEITNPFLLLAAAKTGRPIILSTGMSTLAEVQQALRVLAFGMTGRGRGSMAAFADAYATAKARMALLERVTLLHCTTEYPAPFESVHLRAMDTLAETFGLAVGYSDHTKGTAVAIAAVARGAAVIEKHFTLDRALPGPDHAASLEPDELAAMVTAIRDVESALGQSTKTVAKAERANRAVARRSLVARRRIPAGTVLTAADLTCKRPGTGISPMRYWEVLGQPATRDYMPDELIEDATKSS